MVWFASKGKDSLHRDVRWMMILITLLNIKKYYCIVKFRYHIYFLTLNLFEQVTDLINQTCIGECRNSTKILLVGLDNRIGHFSQVAIIYSLIFCKFGFRNERTRSEFCSRMISSCILNRRKEDCSQVQQFGVTFFAGCVAGAVGTKIPYHADEIASSLCNG